VLADEAGHRLDRHQDQPPRVGPRLDRAQECADAVDQHLLGIRVLGRQRRQLGELQQRPLLLALQQRLEQVGEGPEQVVDDRLGDAGLARDPLHRDAAVSLLGDQVERRVEQLRAPLLRRHPRRVAALGPAGLGAHAGTASSSAGSVPGTSVR
jgi:hypothetical protein